ncbi:MAG TPA: ATP-binding cassette domain-containing protein [Bacteroidia bacterium]|jgi:ABC-2 type transport system ATP-binding protein|nr:ATP-binding cassette domain-containing protein [Bacteroidia bacterium]
MISIKNLTVQFSTTIVLNNISIDFTSNRIHGIVGLNGAGKTTFFNTLSTNLKADSGELTYNENKLNSRDIAYLETNNFFYSRLTGSEYLNIFTQTNPDFNLNTLQEFMQLPLDELVESYSTGMKKKLALLAILKQQRSVFLLDEPFNGLDLETNKIVELIITNLKTKGKTIFLSSHIIDPLLSVCDEIHFLENGKFTKKFEKNDFHKIEEELFRKLKTEAQGKIANSI